MTLSKLREAGKNMVFFGVLLLFIWSGYELSARFDTLSKATYTVYLMAKEHNDSFWDVLFKYHYYEALRLPIFLSLCMVFAVIVFMFRNKPLWGYASIPISFLLTWASFDAKIFFSRSFWELLRLLPLVLIIFGSAVNLFFFYYLQKRHKKKAATLPPGGRRFQ